MAPNSLVGNGGYSTVSLITADRLKLEGPSGQGLFHSLADLTALDPGVQVFAGAGGSRMIAMPRNRFRRHTMSRTGPGQQRDQRLGLGLVDRLLRIVTDKAD